MTVIAVVASVVLFLVKSFIKLRQELLGGNTNDVCLCPTERRRRESREEHRTTVRVSALCCVVTFLSRVKGECASFPRVALSEEECFCIEVLCCVMLCLPVFCCWSECPVLRRLVKSCVFGLRVNVFCFLKVCCVMSRVAPSGKHVA